MDQAYKHSMLGLYIEELNDVANTFNFHDLESEQYFNAYRKECEEWFNNNIPVEDHCCSICGGSGVIPDYEDEWPCHSCWGIGHSFSKA